jgi:hypothetical protein
MTRKQLIVPEFILTREWKSQGECGSYPLLRFHSNISFESDSNISTYSQAKADTLFIELSVALYFSEWLEKS